MGIIFEIPPVRSFIAALLDKHGVKVPLINTRITRLLWGLETILGLGPELTREEMISAIMETDWAKGWAHGIATKLLGLVPDTPEYREAVERLKRKGAEGMIT